MSMTIIIEDMKQSGGGGGGGGSYCPYCVGLHSHGLIFFSIRGGGGGRGEWWILLLFYGRQTLARSVFRRCREGDINTLKGGEY